QIHFDSIWSYSIPVEDNYTVSALIERANKNAGQELDDPEIVKGDIAVYTGLQNADPCTSRGCKWRSSRNGNVYVPYVIAKQYCKEHSFARSTCIRFTRRTSQKDYLYIQSRSGCWSFVGRRGKKQVVSLAKSGCVYHKVIQHELLHALGFNHEQSRSDRDSHVRILYKNIIKGKEHNFRKIKTNNLGTPYDYGSIMHYGRKSFSRNGRPTIVPIPNPNVVIGKASKMSRFDIKRVNLLYKC
ncbi:high choriolytic enzyme 1-like, partial [Clupea harengus]|uniref:Metalloendopeptidase n=1 Tax=Clupea harengus TaxID=7950 RepID=A0A6P8F8U7_CLUHA